LLSVKFAQASFWLYVYAPWLRDLLIYVKQRYNNPPIFITENGKKITLSIFISWLVSIDREITLKFGCRSEWIPCGELQSITWRSAEWYVAYKLLFWASALHTSGYKVPVKHCHTHNLFIQLFIWRYSLKRAMSIWHMKNPWKSPKKCPPHPSRKVSFQTFTCPRKNC